MGKYFNSQMASESEDPGTQPLTSTPQRSRFLTCVRETRRGGDGLRPPHWGGAKRGPQTRPAGASPSPQPQGLQRGDVPPTATAPPSLSRSPRGVALNQRVIATPEGPLGTGDVWRPHK